MESGIKWQPFKDLYDNTQQFALNKTTSIHPLKILLRRHKPEFLSLLKNRPQNADDRAKVQNRTGLSVRADTKIIDNGFVAEALIVSDLFNLNELAAVDLLLAGDLQKPNYTNYTRGLVAVLLYWDGRRNLVASLRTLIQCRKGRSWLLDLTDDAVTMATTFTDELLSNGLTQQILQLIQNIDVEAEIEKLGKQKGLGDAKHRRQIRDLITEVRQCLADCLFYFAAQSGLPRVDVTAIIEHLRQHSQVEGNGKLTPSTLALLFCAMYAITLPCDASIDQDDKGAEELLNHPLIADKNFMSSINKVLVVDRNVWKVSGVCAWLQLTWSLTLRSIAQSPLAGSMAPACGDILEQDEMVLELALADRVFLFLKENVVSSNSFRCEEFYIRRIHETIIDVIVNMPLKVKEMRNHGDEVARIIMLHLVEGEEPPAELRKDFQHLMELITSVYDKDSLNLQLSADYWCPTDPSMVSDGSYVATRRLPHKQMSLFKFIRQSGDILPPLLYIPYLRMLSALATGPRSARAAFEMLRTNSPTIGGNGESLISWDHFFMSCHRYYDNLRQDRHPLDGSSSFMMMSQSALPPQASPRTCSITPQEVDGLRAVMQLVARVAQYDEIACVAFYEDNQWSVCGILFGLLQCPVPVTLKGDILITLAHLARLPDIAIGLLQATESTQILQSIPGTGKPGGIAAELEEIESREEQYAMTRGFVNLLSAISNLSMLGEGFNSYLVFVVESVYLRLMSRAYVRAEEKWEVASASLIFFNRILVQYQPLPEHFNEDKTIVMSSQDSFRSTTATAPGKLPGFSLLLYINNEGNFFKTIMQTVDDCISYLSSYVTKQDLERTLVEATIQSMQLLLNALDMQDNFLAAMRSSGSSLLITTLDKLLFGINPRTGKADYIINIARFISHNATHPQLSLLAVRIISWLCFSSSHRQVVTAMMNSCKMNVRQRIIHGFVEVLDSSGSGSEEETDQPMTSDCRLAIVRLLVHCIDHPTSNFSHLLLGFDPNKHPRQVNLQDPGVLGASRSCLHSILTILSSDAAQPASILETPKLAELCYQLIYRLASNMDTTEPVLRYLRSSYDFLYKHLKFLPFNSGGEVTNTIMMQQSWLLKTVAIELHTLALKQQRTNVQRLVQVLFSQPSVDAASTSVIGQSLNQSHLSIRDTTVHSVSLLDTSSRPTPNILSIIQMFEVVDLSQTFPSPLTLDQFIPSVVEDGIKSCESNNEHGVVFCDIKTLHRLLESSLSTLGSEDINRKRLASQDMQNILQNAVERNQMRETVHAKLLFISAWRHTLEVALTSCPDDLLPKATRQQVLFTVLQHLVNAVRDNDAVQELTSPIAGVVLTLVMQIRACLMVPPSGHRSFSGDERSSQDVFNHLASLQVIVRGILEWLLQSGVNQKVRVNLYASLLHYLQLCQQTKQHSSRLLDRTSLRSAREDVYARLTRENIRLLRDYGDAYMDLLCKDAFCGHSVCRILAFGCLDSIVLIDAEQMWLQFMIKNGYLNHVANSFLQEDESLQEYLVPTSGPLRSVYIYEQKMALLCSIVHSPGGARAIIDSGVLTELSRCSFLEMRPNTDYSDDPSVPSGLSRYRQLLFPVLHLCSALLTALGGPTHHEVCALVLQFILSHVQPIVTCVLRANSYDEQELLELKLVTGILCQTTGQDFSDSNLYPNIPQVILMEIQGHLLRIQRQLLSLLPQYFVSDNFLSNMKAKMENPQSFNKIHLLMHEIASNILAYCRVIVTRTSDFDSALLFSPDLAESSVNNTIYGRDDLHRPSMGVLVKVLRTMLARYSSEKDSVSKLKYKLENVETLTSQDLKEILDSSDDLVKLSLPQEQKQASSILGKTVTTKNKLLQCLQYIIETTLFLLWQHLDYYVTSAVSMATTSENILFPSKSQSRLAPRRLQDISNVTFEEAPVAAKRILKSSDIGQLKSEVPSCLSEPFLKKLSAVESKGAFIRPLVRRIQYIKLQLSK